MSSEVNEWKRGYLLVFASTLGMAVSVTHIYSVGVLTELIERDQGWARANISAGLLIISAITVIGAPFIGVVIDRVGPRWVGISGVILYCLSFGILGLTTSSIWVWWALWIPLSFGSLLVKPTVWAAAVSHQFSRHRGLAIAVALTGSSLGALYIPYLTYQLSEHFGWRIAIMVLAAGSLLAALPFIVAFFRTHSSSASTLAAARHRPADRLNVRDLLADTRFLRLALIAVVLTAAIVGMNMQFVPIMSSLGLSRSSAAQIASAIGLGAIVGRLSTGFFLDRFHGPWVGSMSFSIPLLACALLLFGFDPSQSLHAVMVAFLLGVGAGAETDVIAYLSAKYFRLSNYGAVFGTLAGLISFGAGLGSTIAAGIYDAWGTYVPFIWIAIMAFVVAMISVGTLGPYPETENSAST